MILQFSLILQFYVKVDPYKISAVRKIKKHKISRYPRKKKLTQN